MSVILEPAIILPSIQVNIGGLKVCAVLSTVGFSSIHEKVFDKICEESNHKKIDDVRSIELDITINGHSITLSEVSVVLDLFVDMILGYDFFNRFKVMLHFGIKSLKWDFEEKVIITKMLETDELLRAISGGSAGQKSNGSANQQIEKQTSCRNDKGEPSSATDYVTFSIPSVSVVFEEDKSVKSQGKKAKKKKGKKAQNLDASKTMNSASECDAKVKWVKVYIAELFFISKYTGEPLGFYATFWGEQHKNNHISYPVDVDEKIGDGVHFDGLEYIFEQAVKDKIDSLHILSGNPTVVDAMKAFQDDDKPKLENLKPGSCEEFSYENEYKMFTHVCHLSKKIKYIKYEYVDFEKKSPIMIKLNEDLWERFKFQALVDFHNEHTRGEFSESESDSDYLFSLLN